jgi:tripartite-type tricarboxylate transporter receptor subunit TctC
MLAKVKFVQVPYRGSAPALQGLVAGDVDIMFDNLGVSLALVQGHQLKLIAVGTERRMASLPEVPTIAETLPGFASSAWFAMVAPPGTPRPIAEKISADIDMALRQPEIEARLKDLSAEAVGGTSAAAGKFMHEEAERWRAVIAAAGIKLE